MTHQDPEKPSNLQLEIGERRSYRIHGIHVRSIEPIIPEIRELADCWNGTTLRSECAVFAKGIGQTTTSIRSHTVTSDSSGAYDTTLIIPKNVDIIANYPWITTRQAYVEKHERIGYIGPGTAPPMTTFQTPTEQMGCLGQVYRPRHLNYTVGYVTGSDLWLIRSMESV
jgi:hypothetical protein